MGDVTLSASVRASLLSLQNTTTLITQTQGRLSEGLKVSSAIDDPVAFFQAKSLSDRAGDLLEKKDGIDQGISTVTAALDGVEGIESLVNQLKGVANSAKSATNAQIADLVTQFNDLKTQINNLATDAIYQGTNLINGTGSTLSVEFSEKTASKLDVTSVDLTAGTDGLSIADAASYTGDSAVGFTIAADAAANTGAEVGSRYVATDFALTWNATDVTFAAGETISFTYGTGTSLSLTVGTGAPLTVANGGTIDVDIVTAATSLASTSDVALVATSTRNVYVQYAAQTLTGADGNVTAATGAATIDTFVFTYNGNNAITLTTADNGLILATAGGNHTLNLASGTTLTLTGAGDVITVNNFSDATAGAAAGTGAYIVFSGTTVATGTDVTATTASIAEAFGVDLAGALTSVTAGNIVRTGLISAGNTTEINAVITQLDTALTTLRTNAQTLGTNVALLNTRLNFTQEYTNTLQAGSDKLVLADINEEGANLLALQTRQQLGIQALSLAAQAEASILRLFG
jgi:flagellin